MTLPRFIALTAALVLATPAVAQPIRPFSLAALKTAQAHGQSVLVDVFAPWCPTCRAQAPTIDALANDPAYAKVIILRLDFDNQVAEKRALGVSKQSTLITYHGAKETGRTLGITQPDQIRTFAATALR